MSASFGGMLNILPVNVVFISGGFVDLQRYSYFLFLTTFLHSFSDSRETEFCSLLIITSSSSISSSTSRILGSTSVIISVFSSSQDKTRESIGSKALIIYHFIALKDLCKSIQPYGGPGQERVNFYFNITFRNSRVVKC